LPLKRPFNRWIATVNQKVYTKEMIGRFRHKRLEEIYLTGKTRRIGADHIRKCVRILQLLEVAKRPEDMNIAGFRFHGLARQTKTLVDARNRELPDHFWLVR
jgi:plasmid maintenance system killer protein